MRLCLYAEKICRHHLLVRDLTAMGLDVPLELYGTLPALAGALRDQRSPETIVILMIGERRTLDQLPPLRELFSDVQIVLILPDHSAATVAAGHRFFPRYISYMDGDLQDVCAVLNKMIHRIHSDENRVA